jgi:hypothetical protein
MGDSAIRVVGPQRMTPPHLSQEGIEVQQQVQRHLGRCLMRIQQYEHIAKALAAHADIAGPANELLTIQGKRIEKAATASLGTLVKGEGTAFTNLRTLNISTKRGNGTRHSCKHRKSWQYWPEIQPNFQMKFASRSHRYCASSSYFCSACQNPGAP